MVSVIEHETDKRLTVALENILRVLILNALPFSIVKTSISFAVIFNLTLNSRYQFEYNGNIVVKNDGFITLVSI